MEDNNQQKEIKKQKIVPSYMKSKVDVNSTQKKPIFKSKVTRILVFILLIVALTTLVLFVYNIVQTNKYKEYETYSSKMNIYGFGQLYDNNTITEYQKVSKSEALKIIISATLNISNIDKIIYIENKEFENQEWVQYAIDNGIISSDEINIDNCNKKSTLLDCLKYLYMSKTKLLNLQPDIEAVPKYTDFDNYSNEEQLIIKDMIWNKIIDNEVVKLNGNKKITKGEFSKLIILFCEKYNTITENDYKLNINSEKLPSNYADYPYCLANVNKEIYETRYFYSDVSKFKKPVELYAEYKENYYSLALRVQQYMSTILNIDYNFISEEEFKSGLDDTLFNPVPDESIKKYVEYVKSNHIILRGNCTVIYPVFYFDGQNYRIRCSVSYNIENADKMENLLFGDAAGLNSSYKYDNNFQAIIDIPINKFENSKSLYILFESMNKWIVKNANE